MKRKKRRRQNESKAWQVFSSGRRIYENEQSFHRTLATLHWFLNEKEIENTTLFPISKSGKERRKIAERNRAELALAGARSWRRSQSSNSSLGELEIGTQSAEHSLGAKAVSPLISQITGARIRYQFASQQFRGLRSTQLRRVQRAQSRAIARPRDDNDDDDDNHRRHVRCRCTTKRETRNEGGLLDELRICAGTWKPTSWRRRPRYPRSTSAVDVYSPKTEGRNDGRWQRRLGLSFAN